MRPFELSRPLAVFALFLNVAAQAQPTSPPIPLVPWPSDLQAPVTAGARIAQGAVIAVPAGDAGARRVAESLAAMAARDRGLRLVVRSGTRGAIVVQRTTATASAASGGVATGASESYRLTVTPAGATLAAGSDAGLFYASVSLWQLMTADAARGPVTLPALQIADTPRFAWRGLMLDVVRHFMPLADVKAMVDQMALHKLNVLHLHLSDDQGWRIEIKRYPLLTQVGGWRQPPGGEPARYGGFYTQAELRELVAYAAARHIRVVPELDMPGHAQAVVAAYPQLGVDIGTGPGQNPPPAVSVDWGVNPYLYNVEDTTLRFIEQVLDEVMAVFPSTFIHVGGDEAIKDQWQASPTVQARRKALGVSNEEALQGWFIERVANYLAAHGRRLIGWDEILEGGLPAGASVMSWRGSAGAVSAAKLGHDVVLAPAGALYFDYQQSDAADEPAGRVALLPIENVYRFEPVSDELGAEQVRHVLGLEAALWTEYMPSRERVEHAVFPRLAALAEVAWSPKGARDWRGFLPRLAAQRARYLRQGVNAADSAFAVRFDIDGGRAAMLAAGQAQVRLSNPVGYGAVHYTLDGSEPTPASPRVDSGHSAIPLNLGARVRATAFDTAGAPLARMRERRFDAASLLRRSSAELRACPGSDLGLRLPLRPEAEAWAPVFNVSLLDACWIYPQALLDGVDAIHVDAARLARNYGLAHEAVKVVQYPATTPGGELEVLDGGCAGPVLVRLPLPDGASLQTVHLSAPLPAPVTGTRDLCLRFTAPISGPLWAIDTVQLQRSAPPPSR